MTRVWVYQQMATELEVVAFAQGGIHQSTSIDAVPVLKPFIMYRQTSDVEGMRGDDMEQTRDVGFMIFVHDVPGDYMRIDRGMNLLRWLFRDTEDPANGIIRSRWLETSDDLRDEDMGTIVKFARVRITKRI